MIGTGRSRYEILAEKAKQWYFQGLIIVVVSCVAIVLFIWWCQSVPIE